MSAYDDITEGLDEIRRSAFVSGTTKKSYKQASPQEAPRVFSYLDGGAEPSPFPTTLMGSGLTKVERGRRALSPTPPPPPPTGYPASYFAGPLGNQNPLPTKPGALLILWPNGSGVSAQNARIADLEQRMGRSFDGIGIHYGGGGTFGGAATCAYIGSERREQWVHDRGSIPVVSWSPDRSLADINAGNADACFRAVADYFKSFGFPIMLRAFWEHNGDWMAWSGYRQPFIDAWRRMVTLFKERGASNVGFFWSPQEGGQDRAGTLASYPGDEWCDWVGSDVYNWCRSGESGCWVTPIHSGWAEFWEILDYGPESIHDNFGARKPIIVGETNCVYDPAQPTKRGQWYRNIPAAAKNMEYLRGVQFFDVDVSAAEGEKARWPVDYPTTEASVFEGFKALALDPWFNTRTR